MKLTETEQDIVDKAKDILHKHLVKGLKLDMPFLTYDYLRCKLSQLEHEVFGCLFLDPKLNLIKDCTLFRGSMRACSVSPREVAKEALSANANSVILYHNHPSGDCTPSEGDLNTTKILKDSLYLVDVHVIDHIIIGGLSYYSFRENENVL